MLAKGPHKGLVGEQLGGTPAVSGLQIKLGGRLPILTLKHHRRSTLYKSLQCSDTL